MIQLAYLIPIFPLLGFLINGIGWRTMPKQAAGFLASLMMLVSFGIALGVFFEVKAGAPATIIPLFDFIKTSAIDIPFAFKIDSLSSLFLIIITGVGFLIHVYSTSYMHDDEGVVKYFAYLNLFVFSMLLLVMGANYVIMFIGWEGVGLCSYLLIGFWYKNRDYTNAAKKAFVMNRIGDLGFIVGMMLVLYHFGSLSYDQLFQQIGTGHHVMSHSLFFWIAISFFIGAMGKSAQVPLFTWLPDAMAGPTPVSALIHAATMVTAGIYMIARSSVIYNLAPEALNFIAIIGLVTALLAASIALVQYDIKKVLAYSTVSQLGFMFIAIGCGSYTTAVFHVMTHAFFKALLFLGSGSVIHAMGGDQDIRNMGGLGKKMKITQITFLIGCLAIAGIPPLAGFFSKDEILANAFMKHPLLYALTLVAALMTAFYMFRLYFLTFSGKFRGTHDQEHHLHESPTAMTFPLIVLAVLAIISGFVGLPAVFSEHHSLNAFLGTAVTNFGEAHHLSHSTEYMLMGISVSLVAIMIGYAYSKTKNPDFKANVGLAKMLENKWYIDELYDSAIVKPTMKLSALLDQYVESKGIDGGVNGIGKLVKWSSDRVRYLQNGQVGAYLFAMVIGIVLVCAIGLFFTNL
jgi:NADH-quinone oxidoreductase subunit L